MLPLLYQSTSPKPSPQSMQVIGRLAKCEKCTITNQINNNYQLSATIAPTDTFINDIQNQRFIMAKPNPTDPPQYFEIYDHQFDEVGRLSVTARHIKHCAYNNVILSDTADGAVTDTPQNHWDFCCTNTNLTFDNFFTFSSPITATAPMEVGYTKADSIGIFLENLTKAFGAELYYNNFNISLLQSLGTKKNYTLRWNKNIGSPQLDISGSSIYTHVVAYGDFTAKFTISGVYHEFPVQLCSNPTAIPNATNTIYKIYMYNASDQFESKDVDPTSGTGYNGIKTTLGAICRDYARNIAAGALQTKDNVNLTVKFRPALDEMSEIGLGDTVDVMLKGGRTVEARVTKTSFDSLAERWTSIELGKEKMKLSNYIAKTR